MATTHQSSVIVPTTQVSPCPPDEDVFGFRLSNDRKDFSPDGLQALASSIEREGLLSPPTVYDSGHLVCLHCGTRDPESPCCAAPEVKPLLYLAAGERRYRAITQFLGWENMPVFLRTDVSPEELSSIMLVENLNREDLPPLAEAHAYRRRMVDHDWSDNDVAERVGKPLRRVKQMLSLLTLIPDLQNLLDQGHIGLNHALALVELPADVQRAALSALTKRDLTVSQTKQMVTQMMANRATQSDLLDLAAFWVQQAEEDAQLQQSLRSREAMIPTSDELPVCVGDRRDTAGDIIYRYMCALRDQGYASEAAAVGNLFTTLLRYRKAKNFRTHPELGELSETA